MHRIWIGLDPKFVMGCVGGAVVLMVLYMHFWAFPVMGWSTSVQQQYPTYTAPPAAAAPVR